MTQDLARFANALREVLGLDPLYVDGRWDPDMRGDEVRFYIAPFREPGPRDASLCPINHCRGRQ